MKVNLTLLDTGFFFIGDLGLSTQKKTQELETDKQSDAFLATIVTATAHGKLSSDVPLEDLIVLIKDIGLRKRVAKMAMIKIPDVNESEIINKPQIKVVPVVEGPSEPVLSSVLDGSVRKVINNLANAKLTRIELNELITLETAAKDRAAVKAAISGLLAG